jgi:hypothetical protein
MSSQQLGVSRQSDDIAGQPESSHAAEALAQQKVQRSFKRIHAVEIDLNRAM